MEITDLQKESLDKIANIISQLNLVNLREEYKKRNLGVCSKMKKKNLIFGILEYENNRIINGNFEPEVKTEIFEPEVKNGNFEPEVKNGGNHQSRGWCYTINNWTSEEYELLSELECRFHVIGKEIGENGTPHLQGYIEFNNRGKRLGGCKKINSRAHWEVRRGTPEEAFVYCKKDGDWWTVGNLPEQGARKDLQNIAEQIKNGTKVDEIMLNDPVLYHKYGRTMNKLEDLRMRKEYRKEMTKGVWYFGKTNVGKSHIAYEGFSPETHYNFPSDNGWWDGYEQQETVIINEFRGSLSYSFLLQLVDKWPVTVKRRNREPIPFTSKKVIITSSQRPEDVYFNLAEKDSMEQLYRRFEVVKVLPGGILQVCKSGTKNGNFGEPEVLKGNTVLEKFSPSAKIETSENNNFDNNFNIGDNFC